MTNSVRIVDKGWGRELIFADTPLYAGKILEFDRQGARFSLHFHAEKDETWYVLEGEFKVEMREMLDATRYARELRPGDVWNNAPLQPHRLTCLSERGRIVEVSTFDDPNDNHRIEPGDSQAKPEREKWVD